MEQNKYRNEICRDEHHRQSYHRRCGDTEHEYGAQRNGAYDD